MQVMATLENGALLPLFLCHSLSLYHTTQQTPLHEERRRFATHLVRSGRRIGVHRLQRFQEASFPSSTPPECSDSQRWYI